MALRAVVAAWAELGASISVVASSELDELTGRAGHRASVGIDVKRVLCELAVSRRRWLHLHVGDGPFRLDVFDEICTAVRGVAKDLDQPVAVRLCIGPLFQLLSWSRFFRLIIRGGVVGG